MSGAGRAKKAVAAAKVTDKELLAVLQEANSVQGILDGLATAQSYFFQNEGEPKQLIGLQVYLGTIYSAFLGYPGANKERHVALLSRLMNEISDVMAGSKTTIFEVQGQSGGGTDSARWRALKQFCIASYMAFCEAELSQGAASQAAAGAFAQAGYKGHRGGALSGKTVQNWANKLKTDNDKLLVQLVQNALEGVRLNGARFDSNGAKAAAKLLVEKCRRETGLLTHSPPP